MSQLENVLHLTADGKNAYLPCSCGDNSDSIAFSYWSDEPEDCIFIGVSIQNGDSFLWRLKAAWRALTRTVHRDSVGINRETAKALSAWLTEKAESPANHP